MCYNLNMEQNSRIVKNYFSKETIELKNPIAVTVREQNLGKDPDAFRRLLDGRNTFTRNGWYLLHKEAEALEKILGYCNDCRTVFSALTSTRTHIRKGHDAKIITADSKNIVLNAIHSKSYIINEYLEEHKKIDSSVLYIPKNQRNLVTNGGVYKITNTVNGKFYIGSAGVFKDRIDEHLRALKNNTHANIILQRAWNARPSLFYVEFIKVADPKFSREKIYEMEQKTLDKLYDKDMCYNISKDAFGPNVENRCVRVNMLSLEKKELIRTFGSIVDASKEMNLNPRNIYAACAGYSLSSGGYGWEYADKKVENPPKIFKGRKKPNPVVVYNYKNNTVEEFDSCVSAADSIDSTEGTVRAVANRNKTCVSDGKFPKALKEIFVFYKRHFDLEKINKVLNKGIPCSYCEVPYANERGLLSHEGVCVDNPIVVEQSRIKNDPKESFEQFVSGLGNLGKNRFVFVDVEDSKVQDKNYLSNIKNNIISEGNVPYFFLSTDWRNEKKKEIIKSMIYYRVRKNIISIGARKLIVDCSVSSSEAQEFFDKNHLNGHVLASGYFGLRDKNTREIVQLISVRTPLHKKYRELGLIEIGRSASKIGHVVPGGFSRLIGEIESHYKKLGHLGIISYVDLMIGSGESYNDKFIKQSDTGVGYFYTDGERSYNRFRFRAKNGKSENEIARDAGVWKVYNLGNSLFVRKFS